MLDGEPTPAIQVVIWQDGPLWEYDLQDRREPRFRSTGAHRTLEAAITSVRDDLASLKPGD